MTESPKVEEKPADDDFKNSLAALIGKGKPKPMKKIEKKVEEPPKPAQNKKVNIFDDDE